MPCATLAVGAPTVLAGGVPVPCSVSSLYYRLLVPIPKSLAGDPAVQERSRFSRPAGGPPCRRFHLGGDAARESNFPTAAAGDRSRAGVLGILRVRADHLEPFCRRLAYRFSGPRWFLRAFLFRLCRGLRGRGGCLDRRIGLPSICDPAEMAGPAVEGIRDHRAPDFPADDHRSRDLRERMGIEPLAVVGAHAHASHISAAGPAHQASAPGAQPRYGLLEARYVQQDSAAGG